MRTILLNTEIVAFVDDEDYDRLSKYNWSISQSESSTQIRRYEGTKRDGRWVPMANDVLQLYGVLIDHKNLNPFDNQKSNLRQATHSQNMMNRSKFSNTTSKYKGVSWKKSNKKWVAQARYNGIVVYLGSFENELEAARAYNEYAKQYYGEFALLNNLP